MTPEWNISCSISRGKDGAQAPERFAWCSGIGPAMRSIGLGAGGWLVVVGCLRGMWRWRAMWRWWRRSRFSLSGGRGVDRAASSPKREIRGRTLSWAFWTGRAGGHRIIFNVTIARSSRVPGIIKPPPCRIMWRIAPRGRSCHGFRLCGGCVAELGDSKQDRV